MKFFVTSLLILVSSLAHGQVSHTYLPSTDEAAVKADIKTGGKFHYNVFYTYDRPITDFSANLIPQIIAQTAPKYIQLSAKLSGEYEKFFTQSIQDHFDYSINTKMSVNEGGSSSLIVDLDHFQFSDPSVNATYGRIEHQKSEARTQYTHRNEGGNYVKVIAKYKFEDIRTPGYTFNKNYLRHYNAELVGQYDFRFLPETFWFVRATGGMREYVNPNLDATSVSQYVTDANFNSIKTRSTYGLGEVGISGRLTDKTSVDAATGFLARMYPYGDSFISPVFYLNFIEQVTRRDQLIAGYNYTVEDAYSTNWFLNQEIYIGLARMMGDQVLLLVKMSYEYKNYSTPVVRNDQRVTGGGIIKYSFKPELKFFAEMKVDLLATDFYDTNTLTNSNPDRPASYRSGYMGAGIMANF